MGCERATTHQQKHNRARHGRNAHNDTMHRIFVEKLQHKPHKPNTPIQLGDGSLGPMAHGAGPAKIPDVDIVIKNVI